MDEIDRLSDSELRHRLMQYGFPNMPVTETTRKILIRKLRNHINEAKTRLRNKANSMLHNSSDEEPEAGLKSSIRGRSSILRKTGPSSEAKASIRMPPPASPVVSKRSAFSRPSINSKSHAAEGGSSTFRSSGFSSANKQKTSPKIYVPPPIRASDEEDAPDYLKPTRHYTNSDASNTFSNPYTTSTNNYHLDGSYNESWNSNSSFYSSTPPVTASLSPTSNNCNGQHSINEHGYGGDFTKRLLKLRGETIRDSIIQQRNVVGNGGSKLPLRPISTSPSTMDPSDIVYQQSERIEGNISPSSAFKQLISRLDEQYGFKQTFIPCALVSTLLLFFFLLTFFYMTIRPDLLGTISSENIAYSLCKDYYANPSSLTDINQSCIWEDELPSAIRLLRHLVTKLQQKAEIHFCQDSGQDLAVSDEDFVRQVNMIEQGLDNDKMLTNLHNVQYLISKNPQWKISFVCSNTGRILDFTDVVSLRQSKGNSFAMLNPRLPLICTISHQIQRAFGYLLSLVSIGCFVFAAHLVYRYFQNKRKAHQAAVEYYTNEIIAELMRKAINIDIIQSTVVVNHLRDKLIPLHKRKQQTKTWNEAIRNLETNDSRIQFDLALRNGEECKTMRWIANVSLDMLSHSNSSLKQWHSPAFDKSNKIANPPTNCLKIRQMFEPVEANNPNLKTIIQDAILEKVGPKCKIYEIQLDKDSCCVYVRCATEVDAGIVHNEINGWWFDKRLVSIKFVRLQRYLSRFPKSSSGPKCLRPSNTNNSSMSQCSSNFASLVNGINGNGDDDDDMELDEDEA